VDVDALDLAAVAVAVEIDHDSGNGGAGERVKQRGLVGGPGLGDAAGMVLIFGEPGVLLRLGIGLGCVVGHVVLLRF
jgi:hypothetical protein